jgi:hypothetical protein
VSQGIAALPGMAGVWLVIGGSISILMGVVGIAEDSLLGRPAGYAYRFDLTAWGWITLVIGVALGLAGVVVLAGKEWGRFAGVATAGASMITQFMFIPYYPVWSITVMALDLAAIWTLIRFSVA